MSVEELRSDLAELRSLLVQSTRPSVKALLQTEIGRVEGAVKKAESAAKPTPSSSTDAAKPAVGKGAALPTVKLTNYGWDESDKFAKLYITLNGVERAAKEEVECVFTTNSFSLSVVLDGKRYEMTMKDLTREIDVEKSSVKQKTDMLVLMMKKREEGKKWECPTKTERAVKEKNKPKFEGGNDESKDPQESLMGLMKQMYDDGDDEMKRTIRKAWHEGQANKGGMPADMMGMDM